MAKSDASVCSSTGCGSGEMEERMGTSSDSAIVHEQSEYVTAFEGGMLINKSSTPSAEQRRAYGMWLEHVKRHCGSEEEFWTAISKPSWTQVVPSPSCSANGLSSSSMEGSSSCLSPAEKREIQVTNGKFFLRRCGWSPYVHFVSKCHPDASSIKSFFKDFGDGLRLGKKIAQGGQAEIYEAHLVENNDLVDGSLQKIVLKVFSLEDSEWFRLLWSKLHGCNFHCGDELLLTWSYSLVRNCTLLKDGRFALVMKRYWGDLRKAINVQLLKDRSHLKPPFPLSIATCIMFKIARGVQDLHARGILHRDLKADNVLVSRDPDKWILNPRTLDRVECHVADYEISEGVMGTRFWRAPEVLGILRSSSKEKYTDRRIWTKKVDVYAYGMTFYEVLSGCIPFQNRAASDYNIGDERPPLPDYVDKEIQELVRKCWDSDPLKRPTFETIIFSLDRFAVSKIEYCRASLEDDLDHKTYRWIHNAYLTIYTK